MVPVPAPAAWLTAEARWPILHECVAQDTLFQKELVVLDGVEE